MAPAERSALEALVGRVLTDDESVAIDGHIGNDDDRRDDLVAALLSQGRTRHVTTRVSAAGLLERWPAGPVEADAFLQKLEQFAQSGHALAGVVRRALKFLGTPEGLDLGAAATHLMLGQLVAGNVITGEEAASAKALSLQPAPVTLAEVSRALNIAQGRMVL
jgi:hypothetical protein